MRKTLFENKFSILLVWGLNTLGAVLGYLDVETLLRMFAFASAGLLSVLGIVKWIHDWFTKKRK